MNAYTRFPFEDNTFDIIYSEHLIEHIKITKVEKLLKECFRVLKPGGIFRVTTPDLAIIAKNYLEENDDFFRQVRKNDPTQDQPRNWLVRSNGGAFMVSAVKDFYHHRWLFDYPTLEGCLNEVGFKDISCASFRVGKNEEAAQMDSPEREYETVYVDAIK